jgi:hypothetical protein
MKHHDEKHRSLLQAKNFLIQTCSHCHEEMHVVEGDMIFGGKWFHLTCWRKVENNIDEHSL